MSELLQLLVWSSLFFYIMKYLGEKRDPDLCCVCMMLTAAKSWSTVVGSTAGFLLPLYHSTVSYCHKILLSRLKTLRSFVNCFAY